ncbi:MAG: arginase family protein [Deltaproteobacteria bacterium]|nr:arginase family protein [Deltaproteobacteria bacterium]
MAAIPDRLVIQPYTVEVETAESLVVRGVVLDRSYQLTPDFLLFLKYFEQPAGREEFLREQAGSYDRAELEAGLDHLCGVGLLVPAQHVDLMRSVQFAPPLAPPFGFEKGDIIGFLQAEQPPAAVVVGFPYDGATTAGSGARSGPESIRYCAPVRPASERIADLASGEVLNSFLGAAIDLGDLRPRPGESAESYGSRIEAVAAAVAARGSMLIGLGGDHSITYPLIKGLQRGRAERGAPGELGLLHFDAHTDFPQADNFHQLHGRHTHGTFVRNVVDDGLATALIQVGVRGLVPGSEAGRSSRLARSHLVIGAHEAAALDCAAFVGRIPAGLPYYLTVDIDVLDPAFAPDTGTPVPGGLSSQRLTELLGWIAQERELAGIDLTEVAGSPCRANRTAAAAADALEHCLVRVLARRG